MLPLHYPGILISGEGVIRNDEVCRGRVNGQEKIGSGDVEGVLNEKGVGLIRKLKHGAAGSTAGRGALQRSRKGDG